MLDDKKSKNRVLVTGHDGYIGSVLVSLLIRSGYEIVGLDTFYFEGCDFISVPKPSIEVLWKDIRDVECADLENVVQVIHLAALSNDPLGEIAEELTMEINYKASLKLAVLSKDAGVRRFIFASSLSLYGKSGDDWLDESSPLLPLTAYARTKALTEHGLLELADENFCPVFLRFGTVYGLAPKLRVDLVVNNLAAWGFTTGKIRILSDGSPWRPLIHVEDVARVYHYFLEAPIDKVYCRAFNIGFNESNYQVKDIAELVASNLPNTQVTFAEQRDKDSRSYRVRFDSFLNLSELQPKWDLNRGIVDLLQGYQKVGMSHSDLLSKKFIRFNQIRSLMNEEQLDSELYWKKQPKGIHAYQSHRNFSDRPQR